MTLHTTPVTLPCMVKMLLCWWWFAPTTWHAHNCEWTSSHRILIWVVEILFWEFQLMICGSITYTVTESTWAKGFNWLDGSWRHDDPSYFPNLCVCKSVCLLACLLDCLFALFWSCHFECFCVSHLFHIKMTKRDCYPFCRGASLNLELDDFLSSFWWWLTIKHHVPPFIKLIYWVILFVSFLWKKKKNYEENKAFNFGIKQLKFWVFFASCQR